MRRQLGGSNNPRCQVSLQRQYSPLKVLFFCSARNSITASRMPWLERQSVSTVATLLNSAGSFQSRTSQLEKEVFFKFACKAWVFSSRTARWVSRLSHTGPRMMGSTTARHCPYIPIIQTLFPHPVATYVNIAFNACCQRKIFHTKMQR